MVIVNTHEIILITKVSHYDYIIVIHALQFTRKDISQYSYILYTDIIKIVAIFTTGTLI